MSTKYRVETGEDSHQVIQLLDDKIYEYNSAKTHQSNGALFSRIVKADGGEIIAGIAGWTWAGACEITLFWVHEGFREKGIGTLLLEAAEEEARNKKCSRILVKSYSFQAPHFYERHGFVVEHIMENFPEGFSYYTLMKMI